MQDGDALLRTYGRIHREHIHWLVLGGLWTFIAFHGALGLVGFRLRRGDIVRSIRLRPYNALAFCTSMAAFVLALLINPL